MTWILFALVAVIGICIGILARQIEALEADLMKTKASLGHTYIEQKKKLDDANNAIAELTEWNKDLCECLKQAVNNLDETDRRCRDIERYYINYVARKEDNGEV